MVSDRMKSQWRPRNLVLFFYCISITVLCVLILGIKNYSNEVTMMGWAENSQLIYDYNTDSESETAEVTSLDISLESWEAPQDIRRDFPYTFAGYDLQNRPVWIVPFGKWNVREKLEESEDNEKILEKFLNQFASRVDESRRLPNSTLDRWVLICDLEGYSYSQLTSVSTVQFLLRVGSIFQNKPDSMAYGFVVNLDWISNLLIKLVRPVLGPSLSKMWTFDSDKETYVKSILEKIPQDHLPPSYGGEEGFEPILEFS